MNLISEAESALRLRPMTTLELAIELDAEERRVVSALRSLSSTRRVEKVGDKWHWREKKSSALPALTERQRSVYDVIIRFGPINQTKIVEASSIPPGSIHAILQALLAHGLVRNEGRLWLGVDVELVEPVQAPPGAPVELVEPVQAPPGDPVELVEPVQALPGDPVELDKPDQAPPGDRVEPDTCGAEVRGGGHLPDDARIVCTRPRGHDGSHYDDAWNAEWGGDVFHVAEPRVFYVAEQRGEVVDELRAGLRGEVLDELRAGLRGEVLDELRAGLRGEVLDQLLASSELRLHAMQTAIEQETRRLKDDAEVLEVLDELRAGLRGEVLDELREGLRGEVLDELRLSMRDEVRREIAREHLTTSERERRMVDQAMQDLAAELYGSEWEDSPRAQIVREHPAFNELSEAIGAAMRDRVEVALRRELRDGVVSTLAHAMLDAAGVPPGDLDERLAEARRYALTVRGLRDLVRA